MNARRIAPIVVVLLSFPAYLLAGTFAHPYSPTSDEQSASQSISDYMSDGWSDEYEMTLPMLGMTLREEGGRLASGAPVGGVGVIAVTAGGPADRAGVNAPHTMLRDAAVTVLFAGGMLFPPAMIGAIAVAQSGIGDAHDLIVAVDGYRTHNLFQFQSAMRMARPGDLVYLRVIRAGEPREVRIAIPPGAGMGLSY